MTRHLIKFSIRALRRQGGYVALNVLGLAIGIACTLAIALFITHELSYDQYHEDKDRIYRVGLHGIFSGTEIRGAWTPAPMGEAMVNDMPEVESFLRMYDWDETVIHVDDQYFIEQDFVEADSTFFDFFSIPLIAGDKETALTEPHSVVLSASAASRLFGDENPLDQMVRIGSGTTLYQITGVMEDVPETTHFRAGMVGSFTTNSRSEETYWTSNSFYTYIKLYPDADPEKVIEGFDDMILKYVGPEIRQMLGISPEEFISQGNMYNYFLQPLPAIHLDPSVDHGHKSSNDPRYLWIFGAVGLLILVIASINFMNLSTAQATKRAKEVGVKKVIGSSRKMLVWQFISETVILSLLALVVAVLILEWALPYFNNMLSLQLSLNYFSNWYSIPGMFLLALLVGLFAGSYPAFYLSAFDPNTVLKGKTAGSKQSTRLRKMLTVMQFVISIVLISGSLVMYKQLNFMLNKDLGFDRENMLVIRHAHVLGDQVDTFKNELEGVSGVVSVSASTAIPGRPNNNNGYMFRGRDEESFLMQTTWADYDFLETYGIGLANGRFFDPSMHTNKEACIINERAVNNYNLNDPLTTQVIIPEGPDERIVKSVIGVTRDYHFESLRNDIAPAIIRFKDEDRNWGYISIRFEPDNVNNVLKETERLWASFASDEPMLHFFLDEDLNRFYHEEEQNALLSVVFTVIAIIIASLGLYGLTAFSLQQRTREIGIRKTFGATVSDIWYLVCKDIMVLLGIATIIAWPLLYWVASNWLQNYPYRISLHVGDFLIGFIVAVLIALFTISYRVLRTASVNPSMSLRYE
ncbi:MAG: FtsX-like permease family protein [Bacteroidales bacterium]